MYDPQPGRVSARSERAILSHPNQLLPAQVASIFAEKRVLITGGLGFIGSNLARALVAAGSHVTLLDSLVPTQGGAMANVAEIANEIAVDLLDIRDGRGLAKWLAGQEILFNLAGHTSHIDSMTNPQMDLELNCRAQLSLLEACRSHNPDVHIIFTSTRQIYGKPRYLPVDEQHPIDPVDVNGINKAAGESYHVLYGRVHGLRISVLRLTNTYGPYMRTIDARQTFLGLWIRQALAGDELLVFGDGTQRRDFTYVDDVVRALCQVAVSPTAIGEVFNVGGEGHASLLEVAELVLRLAGGGGYRVVPFPEDHLRIDIGDYYADDRKLRKSLGWRPLVGLEQGLAATIAFFREHGDA